uniref:Centrosomal protein 78 n=1 Tax=Labrus bergylta TaxID=56723 RepID=A0A3Q3FR50_9LABR
MVQDSAQIRRQGPQDFMAYYEFACARQESVPLPAVKMNLEKGILDFNGDRVKLTDWPPILNSICINKHLHHIAISSTYQAGLGSGEAGKSNFKKKIPAIRSKDMTFKLCKALRDCLGISPNLKTLHLNGLPLRERDLITLTKGLAKSVSLEILSLAKCPIADEGLEVICQSVKYSTSIRTVDFTGCNLTWRGAEHMANIIKHQGMQRHGTAWSESLRYRQPQFEGMRGLRRVTLNCNTLIGDRGAAALAKELAEDLWVKAVDLQRCGLSNEGARRLLESLKTNSSLCVVDIRSNPLVGKKSGRAENIFSWSPRQTYWAGVYMCAGQLYLSYFSNENPLSFCKQEQEKVLDLLSLDLLNMNMLCNCICVCAVVHALQMELKECRLRLAEERRARLKAESRLMEFELENGRLRDNNHSLSEALAATGSASVPSAFGALEDEAILESIETSFTKFHAFLDLLKDAGLGQLASMAGIDKSDFHPPGRPQLSSTVGPHLGVAESLVERIWNGGEQYRSSTGDCAISFPFHLVMPLAEVSDDSAVVGCINDGQEGEYRELVDKFVEWTGRYHLILNLDKTREMVINFRRKRTEPPPLCILGEDVSVVEEYKYLVVNIDDRLNWKANTQAVYKKGMSRLYFLRKLRSFNVCSKMLEIFYQSVVASALFSAVVCWGAALELVTLRD